MASSVDKIKAEASMLLHLFNATNGLLAAPKPESQYSLEEVVTAPIFSLAAHIALCSKPYGQNSMEKMEQEHVEIFPQYGLLGNCLVDGPAIARDPSLIYTNVSAPWSAFICGSQGSGKSHTLSCILENSLLTAFPPGRLTSPLSALVMHYDKFASFASTQLCEAAFLSSSIPVRVMVSPTNEMSMRNAYVNMLGASAGNRLEIVPVYLPKRGLTISMMKTLMGVGSGEHPMYMDMIMKILRDIALANQGRDTFDYDDFKARIDKITWVKGQEAPMRMRLSVLESFFEPEQRARRRQGTGNLTVDLWKFEPGTLTIIDLSCPFVGSDDACALFNIFVSFFLKDRQTAGRILALDEAHKFLGDSSPEAVDLTETMLSIVRQQRHLATRVIIATQEPTVSPQFLDLCNLTMIHRFTSPVWFQAIRSHLAGASINKFEAGRAVENELFRRIVGLKTGQALVFCPTGLLVDKDMGAQGPYEAKGVFGKTYGGLQTPDQVEGNDDSVSSGEEDLFVGNEQAVRMGPRFIQVQVRNRITQDGGRSILTQ